MMKKKLLSAILSLTVISSIGINIAALVYNEENPEVGDGVYDGYDLECERLTYVYSGGNAVCWQPNQDDNGDWYLEYHSVDLEFVNKTIKVPDSINGLTMCYIVGSSEISAFDLNPENPYMECVDNVIFSEDKKKLMSYATLDNRTEYIIPEGTEIIGKNSLFNSNNLNEIIMPNTVDKIEEGAMWGCDNLKTVSLSPKIKTIPKDCFWGDKNLIEVNILKESKFNSIKEGAFSYCDHLAKLYLPSFEIEIDRSAFGPTYEKTLKTQLKSYVQPKITVSENKLSWEKIPNASYYEIYQKLNSGEYKLLKTTKATSLFSRP